ncbi:CLUMA_CG000614, isoform A [Clunio marinus]|uniref:U3 small nucleolar RNA-associated protein 11 n=1 Tax=Clunio marinus TaxID=568069 RepID=A0A1J1HFN6_9DIPT|nr:CLUMA_CG000614, isoform A [Clunio marinus]
MSSWKKATKTNQKTHRERHQPEARKSLGLLEKKKDYKLRAQDRAEKQETLKLLRKRALNKNPDEFYHHMINSKIQDGEHHELDKDEDLTPEQIKLMETQDKKYISMKRTIESNKIKRLQSHLHMTDVAEKTKNKHIFFLENGKELKNFDLAERLQTHPALVGRKTNRIKLKSLDKIKIDIDEEQIKKLNQEREKSYKELEKRIERERELAKVQRKMEIKNLSRAERRTLKSKDLLRVTKSSNPIFKFKYERKK